MISRADILKCFKVGQLIFRPIIHGRLGDVQLTLNREGTHPLKAFVRTVISDPNQSIFEPTVAFGNRGIITWLVDEDGQPFLEEKLPDNWFALRIMRECRAEVFNASILTADADALSYYTIWRQEMSKIFDDYSSVCGLPFEMAPSAARVWFKPVFDEKFSVAGYDAQQIKMVN